MLELATCRPPTRHLSSRAQRCDWPRPEPRPKVLFLDERRSPRRLDAGRDATFLKSYNESSGPRLLPSHYMDARGPVRARASTRAVVLRRVLRGLVPPPPRKRVVLPSSTRRARLLRRSGWWGDDAAEPSAMPHDSLNATFSRAAALRTGLTVEKPHARVRRLSP